VKLKTKDMLVIFIKKNVSSTIAATNPVPECKSIVWVDSKLLHKLCKKGTVGNQSGQNQDIREII
jgi:hypothetical protein